MTWYLRLWDCIDEECLPTYSCDVVRVVATPSRSDLYLVQVAPPMIRAKPESNEGMSQVILATRHPGASLLSIGKNPIHVYVARAVLDSIPENGVLRDDELVIEHWGLVYDHSPAEADRKY